jgi:hypothetical protein
MARECVFQFTEKACFYRLSGRFTCRNEGDGRWREGPCRAAQFAQFISAKFKAGFRNDYLTAPHLKTVTFTVKMSFILTTLIYSSEKWG